MTVRTVKLRGHQFRPESLVRAGSNAPGSTPVSLPSTYVSSTELHVTFDDAQWLTDLLHIWVLQTPSGPTSASVTVSLKEPVITLTTTGRSVTLTAQGGVSNDTYDVDWGGGASSEPWLLNANGDGEITHDYLGTAVVDATIRLYDNGLEFWSAPIHINAAPIIRMLSPDSMMAGLAQPRTLDVFGDNFDNAVPDKVVLVIDVVGIVVPYATPNSGAINAQVNSHDLREPGQVSVQRSVRALNPDGQLSNELLLTITNDVDP